MKNLIIPTLKYGRYEIGTHVFTIASEGEQITGIWYGDTKPEKANKQETDLMRKAATQLEEYFAAKRTDFDFPLAPKGTEFQKKVWEALIQIPFGETRTYKQVAGSIGNPKACRAVGMANHHNPILIVIPCHRVIGANGSLTGYGAGLPLKVELLKIESQERQ